MWRKYVLVVVVRNFRAGRRGRIHIFHDSLTAREVMKFYCDLRKIPVSRIDETLHSPRFNFNGFSDKPVGKFSGGMIQRLGLAVACLPDAPILVLDEPTVSLDPEGAIARAIPARSVVGCVVHASCKTPKPGLVHNVMGQGLIIGEPRGGTSERVAKLAQALNAAAERMIAPTL